MDGRNRIVVRLPSELVTLVQLWHQLCTRNTSLNASVIRLLETHPDLVALAGKLYNETETPTTERHANGSGDYSLASLFPGDLYCR